MDEQKKILIIEDESMIRNALVDKFTSEGFWVFSATNGVEGLKQAKEQLPDIILLDVIMPEMDGITASGVLKEDVTTQNIPVIFLTNLADSDEVAQKITRGDYEFLVKSNWDISEVVEKVRQKLIPVGQ